MVTSHNFHFLYWPALQHMRSQEYNQLVIQLIFTSSQLFAIKAPHKVFYVFKACLFHTIFTVQWGVLGPVNTVNVQK